MNEKKEKDEKKVRRKKESGLRVSFGTREKGKKEKRKKCSVLSGFVWLDRKVRIKK